MTVMCSKGVSGSNSAPFLPSSTKYHGSSSYPCQEVLDYVGASVAIGSQLEMPRRAVLSCQHLFDWQAEGVGIASCYQKPL